MEKTKKRNPIFSLLYALAIIMVIDDHSNSRIGILSSIFPYNSFYMPLFVFVSGYFYKRTKIKDNIIHKTKRLLLPYLIWNMVAIIVVEYLYLVFGIKWLKIISIKQFIINSLFVGDVTSLNGAAWFVIMLFWVSIIYNAIHFRIKDNKAIDFVTTCIYIILGFATLQLCMNGYASVNWLYLFILRTIFYIQFYHLGNMFRKYIEKPLLKHNKVIVCGICVAVNVFLVCLFGDKINFTETGYMNKFNSWYLPLITSITGILFYYEVMEYLARKIGNNRIVDFISRNTFVIMQVHLFFLNIPNFYIYLKVLNGSTLYSDFNMNDFIYSAWTRYNDNTTLIGFFLGLIGSLMVAYIIEKIKNTVNTEKENLPQK